MARHPTAAAAVAGAAAIELALGGASPALAGTALAAALPLVPFLTAAIWLSAHAERTGLADRLARAAGRLARGSRPALYALVCGLCALLTATVSLDGAVVLMVPVASWPSRRAPRSCADRCCSGPSLWRTPSRSRFLRATPRTWS